MTRASSASIKHEALAARLDALLADATVRRDCARPASAALVVDLSTNLAKEMHVGHLRSTIIGDGVARSARFLGDEVIRAEPIGDGVPVRACC
jgi:arginyl-tRNA synthetase